MKKQADMKEGSIYCENNIRLIHNVKVALN
jgi:hypothetical protein